MKKREAGKFPEFVAVRLGTEMRRELEKIAKDEDRSVGYVIRRIVQEWFDSQEKKRKKKET